MTKKAAKKGNAMSLKDFYESAPGQLPLETRLPSKPGELKRDNDAPNKVPSSFSKLSIDESFHGVKEKSGFSQAYSRPSNGLIGVGNGYEQYITNHTYGGRHPQATHPNRVRPGYQDVADQHSSSRSYFMQPPPPPPPRRQPSPPPRKQPSPPPRRQPSPPPRKETTPANQRMLESALDKRADPCTAASHQASQEPSMEVVSRAGKPVSNPPSKAVEVQQDGEQSTTPRNLWAEKMAQTALERMASAKSSLLAGPAAAPANKPLVAFEKNEATNGVFVKPDHPFARPRLALQGRLTPAPEASVKQSSVSAVTQVERIVERAVEKSMERAPEKSIERAVEWSTNRVVDRGESERPKLNLQPRSKPVPVPEAANAFGRPRVNIQPRSKTVADTENKKDSSAPKSRNIFGAARPREEVLKDRGVDAVSLEADKLDRVSHGSYTAGSNSRPSSRAASVTSGVSEDDAWHTVSSKKPSKLQNSIGASEPFHHVVADDVFFSQHAPGAYRHTSHYMPHDGDAHYGSPGAHSKGLGHDTVDNDVPLFKRSLPTRAVSFF